MAVQLLHHCDTCHLSGEPSAARPAMRHESPRELLQQGPVECFFLKGTRAQNRVGVPPAIRHVRRSVVHHF